MCYHKRTIFQSCGHIIWGPEIRACPLQISFDASKWPLACDTMHSHPLHTFSVHTLCPSCREDRLRLDRLRLDKTREILRRTMVDLKMELDRLKMKDPGLALAEVSEAVEKFSLERTARKSRQGLLWTEKFAVRLE